MTAIGGSGARRLRYRRQMTVTEADFPGLENELVSKSPRQFEAERYWLRYTAREWALVAMSRNSSGTCNSRQYVLHSFT